MLHRLAYRAAVVIVALGLSITTASAGPAHAEEHACNGLRVAHAQFHNVAGFEAQDANLESLMTANGCRE